jgi:hypothetical protein
MVKAISERANRARDESAGKLREVGSMLIKIDKDIITLRNDRIGENLT